MDSFDPQTWGLLLAVITSQGVMLRWLVGIIRKDREDSISRDDELHSRVNAVKDSYVRRDDLLTHIKPLEESQRTVATALGKMGDRFDAFLTAQAVKGAQE